MKIKTLALLIGLAVLFGVLAYYSLKKRKPFLTPSAIGAKVLPNLDINRAGKLVITSRSGAVTVAKSKGKWVVASRFNYPANFDKVADTLRELSGLKVGQTVNASPSQLGDFNLVSPVPAGTNQSLNTGTLVELRDEKDGLLASVLIGKSFMRPFTAPSMETFANFGGYSGGQYIQTFDGKIYLVSSVLDRLMESARTWLADDFISASADDLKEITVSGLLRAPIKLVRVKDSNLFTLSDLQPEEGGPENSKVNQITGALNRLGFDDVADPALALKETGLDRGIVFNATTKEGLVYSIRLGNTLANDNFDRYFTLSVTNEIVTGQQISAKPSEETAGDEEQSTQARPEKVPEKKSVSELSAELNRKFASWIYVIKSYRAEPMLLTRDDLIKKPEPPGTENAQSNAPITK